MKLPPRLLVLITSWFWLSSCSQDPSAPISATLEVRLETPAQDDGAALFTISGGPIDSVDALGQALYTARIRENTTRVIVAGSLTAGVIARIHIPNASHRSHYSVTLDQVAARDYASRDVASYALSLGR
ncbi:MAG TPA: hypothetical protein VHH32_06055 [Gemmatimonadales bacterium]|nr:hypothetical protein [Gemmatimonadales bacterium]